VTKSSLNGKKKRIIPAVSISVGGDRGKQIWGLNDGCGEVVGFKFVLLVKKTSLIDSYFKF